MKILIYSDCFIFGGSENVIENLFKSDIITNKFDLKFYYAFNERYKASVDKKFTGFRNIHSVNILSAYNKWGYKNKLDADKLVIKKLYLKARYILSLIFQKTKVYDLYNFFKLYRIFKNESPEILFINNGGYPGAQSCRIAVLSAKKAGIRNIIFNVNNLALPQKSLLDKWLDKKINKTVKFFITASKAAKEQLIEQRKFDHLKCINIPNTLLKEKEQHAYTTESRLRKEFKVSDNEIVLGAAGLLTARKGFDNLIEAVHLLTRKEKILCKLFIFGEGEQRAFLERKVNDYKLESIIILPGYKSNMLRYIKDVDIFVCPSIANEDFPYVILEAMLLGKPVIGTKIAGIPEQVSDNYNGLIVLPRAIKELSDAIMKMILDKKLMQSMGRNSYKRYTENFNNASIMQRYEQLFYLISNTTLKNKINV